MYEREVLNEYFQGERKTPTRLVPNQVAPQDAGKTLSYDKQTFGQAPLKVTSNVYGEQEEEIGGIMGIINEVESEYVGDSPINNAVRMALGKIKQKIEG